MYSLNGPSWSLFFEYIGNLLYALFIRRLGTRALAALTAVLGAAWVWFVAADVSGYDMIGIGWTLDAVNFFGGLLRMLFPFSMGMLLARNFKPVKVKGIFWIAWAVLFGLFSLPAFAKCGAVSINGLYEVACVVLIFPAIVWLVASGETTSKVSAHVCKFLGDISYPLYIVHYPVMYLFYAWLIKNELYSLGATWEVVIMVFAINVTLAYACLKLYDEPVRRWLTRRFIKTKSEEQQN
jgi:peptidoglycan/LPS O-acetylase OafA/YrhL